MATPDGTDLGLPDPNIPDPDLPLAQNSAVSTLNDSTSSNAHAPQDRPPKPKTIDELTALHNIVRPEEIEDQSCLICHQEFGSGADSESALKLPDCGHIFGLQCLKAWLASNNSCPICRKPVLDLPTVRANYIVISIRMEEMPEPMRGPLAAFLEHFNLYLDAERLLLNTALGLSRDDGGLGHNHVLWVRYRPAFPGLQANFEAVVANQHPAIDFQTRNLVTNEQHPFGPERQNTTPNGGDAGPRNERFNAVFEPVRILHEIVELYFNDFSIHLNGFARNMDNVDLGWHLDHFSVRLRQRKSQLRVALATTRATTNMSTTAGLLRCFQDLVDTNLDIDGLANAILLGHPFGDPRPRDNLPMDQW